MQFKPKFADFLIILAVLALGIFITLNSINQKGDYIKVSAAGSDYIFSADGTYDVKGALGITTLEVKNGRARILHSPCPNKTCIAQGWASPLICLPNQVIITSKSEGDFDAVSN